MFHWYVINTYSGHEAKVKANLQHRIQSAGQDHMVRQIVIPTEQVVETKDGQKVQTERRVLPGYVLVQMEMTDDSWSLVKNTPGVTGFVGAANKPAPLSREEIDHLLRVPVRAEAACPRRLRGGRDRQDHRRPPVGLHRGDRRDQP